MDDPHDDTDVPSGTTDGAQMERTLPPVRLDLGATKNVRYVRRALAGETTTVAMSGRRATQTCRETSSSSTGDGHSHYPKALEGAPSRPMLPGA